ncbi:MAG: 4'-phosphopantetheinyl transferase superfamily protein [Lachnospiraceae bacterium]|nr:4'-phosphopantetheinyl transferase superfamily protein [Lachnospiraceae bacterium]
MFLKVYLADISPLYDDEVFETYYKEALPYRKDKVDGLKLKKPKCRSLGAGVLLKKALEDAGVKADFIISDNGKPALKNDELQLLFNLSHSGDRAMCVISDCPVGCDVETVKENKRVADRFFTEAEAKLANRSATDFTRLWTLKESFIKATGEGLARALDSFSLDFDKDENVTGVKVDGIARKEFSFYELNYEDGYRYAICVKGDTKGVKPQVEWVKL